MNQEILKNTVSKLVSAPKGILAIDESLPGCNKRFEKLGIPTTEENRREYRELLVTTPDIEKYISGYITFDETIRQKTKDGILFHEVLKSKGIEVGIKLDKGTVDFPLNPGNKITEGLDGLRERITEYKTMGATFAKWRQIFTIDKNLPMESVMVASSTTLALYALFCQEQDIVPILEPEFLMDGGHSQKECGEVTARNLDILFAQLKIFGVWIPGIILKTNMVISGKDAEVQATVEEVATATIACLKAHVPHDIGGIVFLSGGQDDSKATEHLNTMHMMGELPWPLSFSYARAIQNPTLTHWATHREDIAGAQAKLLERAKANSLASVGKYTTQ